MAHEGYRYGPDGRLVPPGWRMVTEEELARLGWTPPAEDGGDGAAED